MQVDIQSRNFPLTNALRSYVERRLCFDLMRYQPAMSRLQVRLSDVNGPRGGPDKRCQVWVRLIAQPDVVVEDTEADLYNAVDRALGRAARAVSRRVSRGRRFERYSRAGAAFDGGAIRDDHTLVSA
jgi:ribosomal subunit interface protein